MAARMREVTDHELLLQKIILEGILAIQSEQSPRVLEVKLKSFLTPSARGGGRLVSLQRIKERFRIKEQQPGEIGGLEIAAPEQLGSEL